MVVAVVLSARALVLFSIEAFVYRQETDSSRRSSSSKRQEFSIRKSKAFLGGTDGEKRHGCFTTVTPFAITRSRLGSMQASSLDSQIDAGGLYHVIYLAPSRSSCGNTGVAMDWAPPMYLLYGSSGLSVEVAVVAPFLYTRDGTGTIRSTDGNYKTTYSNDFVFFL